MATAETTNLAASITALREQVKTAQRLRAESEAAHALAKTQLAGVDDQLRALGIDPEKSAEELAALETQLAELVAGLRQSVQQEITAYTGILDAAKQAGLR